MKILVLGGSGFVSRCVVMEALAQGNDVWYVTRGNREPVAAAVPVVADRNDASALRSALCAVDVHWDAVLDCICFNAEQAAIDLDVLPEFTSRLIVISTDSLYHPDFKQVPQNESASAYMNDNSYGGQKRKMEEVFLDSCSGILKWTLFRPPHMFGPGSELGCFPLHTRQKDLLARLRAGEPIRLVDGGKHRIQPLYAGDLAKAMVAAIQNPAAYNEVFCIAGPDVIQNREYFELLGEITGLPIRFETVAMDDYLANHDDGYLYFCPRVYDLSKLKAAGLPVPAVHLRDGLKEQVHYLLEMGR